MGRAWALAWVQIVLMQKTLFLQGAALEDFVPTPRAQLLSCHLSAGLTAFGPVVSLSGSSLRKQVDSFGLLKGLVCTKLTCYLRRRNLWLPATRCFLTSSGSTGTLIRLAYGDLLIFDVSWFVGGDRRLGAFGFHASLMIFALTCHACNGSNM